jgi:hypothetical protein
MDLQERRLALLPRQKGSGLQDTYLAALLLLARKLGLWKRSSSLVRRIELEGEAGAVVLLAQEAALLGELTPSEHGHPDGSDASDYAAESYDQGEQRVHVRGGPPRSLPKPSMGPRRSTVN